MKVDYIEQGDCLELIKGIPDASIDCTITSPPYDDLRTYGGKINFNFEKRFWKNTKRRRNDTTGQNKLNDYRR